MTENKVNEEQIEKWRDYFNKHSTRVWDEESGLGRAMSEDVFIKAVEEFNKAAQVKIEKLKTENAQLRVFVKDCDLNYQVELKKRDKLLERVKENSNKFFYEREVAEQWIKDYEELKK